MFTSFVRPALPQDVGILRRPRRAESTHVDDTPLVVVDASGSEVVSGTSTFSVSTSTIFAKRKQKESKRVYDVARVYNEDDDSQYIDVEVVKQISTKHKENDKFSNDTTYSDMPESANVEIRERDVERKS